MSEIKATYLNGIKHGIPTAFGYFVVSFTFGMMGSLGGLSVFHTTLISLTSLTSAGQFAGLNIMLSGGSYTEIIMAMIIINSRYSLMATAMSQKLASGTNQLQKALMSLFITDENFAVAMVEVDKITWQYYLGVATLPYIGWGFGTFLGAMVDNLLSVPMQNAASIALYCMFIALFIPPSKTDTGIRYVLLVTIIFGLCLYYLPLFTFITSGYKIMIAAVLGAIYGAVRFPQEVV